MEFDQCRLHSEWMVDIIWNIEIVALNNVNETYHKGPHVTHFNNQELSKWLTRFYPYLVERIIQLEKLMSEMKKEQEIQAVKAFERFERLQRQLENVSSFLQDLTASQNKPTVRSRQRGSLSSIDECSFSDRAKSPDSAVVDTLNNNAQHKRFSTPFIRL
ncbi:unnamed protein product [Anisakis simplex]|uniref:Exocyst complex component Sec8 n=1 Tax=Anisakis simplex TaxID=6269 RepID=A0A0M3K6N5_ANISI|nr:unnamed protein product [Anisakis simplex]